MTVIITKDFQETSVRVAEQFMALLEQKPKCRLGLATGASAEGVYAQLVAAYRQGRLDFSQASSINLDEYVGLGGDHEQSYCYYMRQHLLRHINLASSYIPDGQADPERELQVFRQNLQEPVDLQLLGVGTNGHIAFNEPGDSLMAAAHVQELDESTIAANSRYFAAMAEVPRRAFTQGMGDIFRARKIVLIASGSSKAAAMQQLLGHDRVSTHCPVTFLKLHPDCSVVIDEALLKLAKQC